MTLIVNHHLRVTSRPCLRYASHLFEQKVRNNYLSKSMQSTSHCWEASEASSVQSLNEITTSESMPTGPTTTISNISRLSWQTNCHSRLHCWTTQAFARCSPFSFLVVFGGLFETWWLRSTAFYLSRYSEKTTGRHAPNSSPTRWSSTSGPSSSSKKVNTSLLPTWDGCTAMTK